MLLYDLNWVQRKASQYFSFQLNGLSRFLFKSVRKFRKTIERQRKEKKVGKMLPSVVKTKVFWHGEKTFHFSYGEICLRDKQRPEGFEALWQRSIKWCLMILKPSLSRKTLKLFLNLAVTFNSIQVSLSTWQSQKILSPVGREALKAENLKKYGDSVAITLDLNNLQPLRDDSKRYEVVESSLRWVSSA